MKSKRHIIILVYYSLEDPLCRGLILQQMIALYPSDCVFHLITSEQERFALDPHAAELKKEELQQSGIFWYPLPFSSGRFFMLKKAYSFFQTFLLIRRLKRKWDAQEIMAMATLAGTFAYLASRILGMRFIQHTYEPHSEILEGSGLLSKKSIRYRIAHYFEAKIAKNAEVILCTSNHMLERLALLGRRMPTYRMPTSIDSDSVNFNAAKRLEWRTQWGFEGNDILLYPGKFGGMYREKEIVEMISFFLKIDENYRAVIVTDYNQQIIRQWAEECMVPDSKYRLVSSVSLEEIPGLISAADIGLIAYKGFEARKYCSPVKTGEYLHCGLPYIVQRETSEDDQIAFECNAGLVLDSWSESSLLSQKELLQSLLHEDKVKQRNRLREVGIAYRGRAHSMTILREVFQIKDAKRNS